MDMCDRRLLGKFIELNDRYGEDMDKFENYIFTNLNEKDDVEIRKLFASIGRFFDNCNIISAKCEEILERCTMNQEEYKEFKITISEIFNSEIELLKILKKLEIALQSKSMPKYNNQLKFLKSLTNNILNKIS